MLEQIADEDILYRRIARHAVRKDGTVSSSAFKVRNEPDNSISVDLARLTTPEATVSRAPKPGFGVGAFAAKIPRSLGFIARHDPKDDNPAHSLIEGENTEEKCYELASKIQVLIQPDPQLPKKVGEG
jgi:hypothetical protein